MSNPYDAIMAAMDDQHLCTMIIETLDGITVDSDDVPVPYPAKGAQVIITNLGDGQISIGGYDIIFDPLSYEIDHSRLIKWSGMTVTEEEYRLGLKVHCSIGEISRETIFHYDAESEANGPCFNRDIGGRIRRMVAEVFAIHVLTGNGNAPI